MMVAVGTRLLKHKVVVQERNTFLFHQKSVSLILKKNKSL